MSSLLVFSQQRGDIGLLTSSHSSEGDLKHSSILCVTPAEVTEKCTEQHKSEKSGRVALQSALHDRIETSGNHRIITVGKDL